MKKSIADKWVNALRSGKYKQIRGQLRKPNEGYCCLGVLCKILKIKYDFRSPLLPNEVLILTKMKNRLGYLSLNGYDKDSLVILNDLPIKNSEGLYHDSLTFDEIADIIQINYKDL